MGCLPQNGQGISRESVSRVDDDNGGCWCVNNNLHVVDCAIMVEISRSMLVCRTCHHSLMETRTGPNSRWHVCKDSSNNHLQCAYKTWKWQCRGIGDSCALEEELLVVVVVAVMKDYPARIIDHRGGKHDVTCSGFCGCHNLESKSASLQYGNPCSIHWQRCCANWYCRTRAIWCRSCSSKVVVVYWVGAAAAS